MKRAPFLCLFLNYHSRRVVETDARSISRLRLHVCTGDGGLALGPRGVRAGTWELSDFDQCVCLVRHRAYSHSLQGR